MADTKKMSVLFENIIKHSDAYLANESIERKQRAAVLDLTQRVRVAKQSLLSDPELWRTITVEGQVDALDEIAGMLRGFKPIPLRKIEIAVAGIVALPGHSVTDPDEP